MFSNSAGQDILDQIKFAADQGFTGWEDNGAMTRPADLQNKIGRTLDPMGMKMGVFVSHADFRTSDFVTKTDKAYQQQLRQVMTQAVEAAKRLGAKWTTVVPSMVNNALDPGYQTANCIANLKLMADVCAPSGLVMVLEPLNWYANHPGLFLRSVPQAYTLCKAVNSPSCKILDDLYHQQIDVGNLIPNMEKAWDEIVYIQVGDNPGRKEPTTGEINYRNIFRWLSQRGYDGIVGMEHGNSKPGKDGEAALIAAYRECDNF
jgi:hydroxypyruvate isomerase